jgi:hypothetical protein
MADLTDAGQLISDDETTDLPALRTWPAVYVFVLLTFAGWVILLTVLSRAFL